MSTGIITPQYGFTPFYAEVPKEGPKSIPQRIDFTTNVSWSIDFSNLTANETITMIQTLFIDNSNNSDSLSVVFEGTQQTLICPPLAQGYFPILTQNWPKCVVSTSGGVVILIEFINIPIPPSVWYVAGNTGGIPNPLPVTISGQPIDVSIDAGSLPVPVTVSGTVPVDIVGTQQPLTAATDQVVMTGSALQLSAISSFAGGLVVQSLTIQNDPNSTSNITIGEAGVTDGVGLILVPGKSKTYGAMDLSLRFVIGAATATANIEAYGI